MNLWDLTKENNISNGFISIANLVGKTVTTILERGLVVFPGYFYM